MFGILRYLVNHEIHFNGIVFADIAELVDLRKIDVLLESALVRFDSPSRQKLYITNKGLEWYRALKEQLG